MLRKAGSKTDFERLGCERPFRLAKRRGVLAEHPAAGPRQDGTVQALASGPRARAEAKLAPRSAFAQGRSS
jgi:hypothetical protein